MPDDASTATTAALMAFIGNAVDMDYGCGTSGAQSDDASDAFRNVLGYGNASNVSDFNHSTVKQQLNWNDPVYLAAYRSKKRCFLGWCSYENGHAWVTDGYKSTYYCESGTSYLLLHMNWGWGGFSDSWYAYNRWNPGTLDYQYKKRMIYNIRP